MSQARDIAKALQLVNTDTNTIVTSAIDSDSLKSSVDKGVNMPTGTIAVSVSADLPTTTTTGSQALVTSTGRLYIFNGNGWYNIATINATPYWIDEASASYTLATDGTGIHVQIAAGDSDGTTPTYTATGDSDFNQIATVTQDSDQGFTIRSIDSDGSASQTAGSGVLTFRASDGIDQASTASTFTISFSVNWSSVSFTTNQFYSYDPSSSGQSAGYLGQVVRIAKDNSRMFGGAESGSTKGVFYIWRRSGSTYVNEASFYPGFNNSGNLPSHNNNSSAGFANCFDVDDAGDRAVVNFNGYHTGSYSTHGAVIVLKRTNQSWAAESGWLFQNQGSNNAYHGFQCCMDGTGTYVVAFQAHLGSLYGAGHLYKRTGTSWAYVGSFVGSGVAGGDQFGLSDARMDATGTRIAVLSKNATGKLWIMRRDSTNFSNTELATGDLGNVRSVSINGDGSYVVVGDDTNKNVFIYVRSGTSWSLQQTINVTAVADGTAAYNFGYSVDIDAAGETIVVGNRDSAPSTIWVYTRSGTTWSKQREIDERALDAIDTNFRSFGEVAINGDADTIVGGGWFLNISGSGQAGDGMMKTYAT